MEKSRYLSPDSGMEDCDVIVKGDFGTALILTKAKYSGEDDCIIIAHWDSGKKCFVDNHENWTNIKRGTRFSVRVVKSKKKLPRNLPSNK